MSTSTDQAYTHIRQSILSGAFPPGMRLREAAIAASTNVSRTPVREALRRLSAEGLVELEANSGARVASWSKEDAEEITALRVVLESFAAELAAQKITDEEFEGLRALQDELDAAVAAPGELDYDAIADFNNRFHDRIVTIAGNLRLRAALTQVVQAPLILRKFATFDRPRLERSMAHHREILAALEARDPAWAASAMRTHILAARAYDDRLEAVAGSDSTAAE